MIIDAFRASGTAIPAGGATRHAPPIVGEVGLVPTPRPSLDPALEPRRAPRTRPEPPRPRRTISEPAATAAPTTPVAPPPADQPPPMWRRVVSALFTVAVLALVVFLWPARLGGTARLVIVSGDSMEPTYDFGDLVVTRDHGTPQIGDIVVFAVPDGEAKGILVIHRVTELGDDGVYRTQGDNRDTPDSWNLTEDDIVGRPLLPIPKGGYVVWYLQQWWVVAILVGLVALFLLWPDAEDELEEGQGAETDVDENVAEDAMTAEPDTRPAPTPMIEPLITVASVTPAFFDDDELRFADPSDETVALTIGDSWTERPIDPAVMDEAVAWLDAQLEQFAASVASSG